MFMLMLMLMAMPGASSRMVGAPDLTVRQMLMVMPVLIQRECRCCMVTEKAPELFA